MVVGGSRSKQRTSEARELLSRAVQQFSSTGAETLPEPSASETRWDDVQSRTHCGTTFSPAHTVGRRSVPHTRWDGVQSRTHGGTAFSPAHTVSVGNVFQQEVHCLGSRK